MQAFGEYIPTETASTCKMRDYKDSTDLVVHQSVVRRLTPLEAERLQGFEDGWCTALPPITDMSDEDLAFWNEVRARDAVIKDKKKPYKPQTKEQMIRWYNSLISSNSNKYRAIGNSIATGNNSFWKFLIKRISAQYNRDITMGSLFDGIGGFPYVHEMINGKGSCLWASEVEPFCIAVTKLRFPQQNK